MKPLRSNKKAFTLVELCIVMALVSIVALLMTSFMAVFQPRVAQNQARHDFLDEVSLVREELRKWIDTNDVGGAGIVVSSSLDDSKIMYRAGDAAETTFYVNFENGKLFTKAGTEESSLELKTIMIISLDAYVSDTNDNGKLLRCTLTGYDAFGTPFSQNLIFSLKSSAKFTNADVGSQD